MDIVLPVQYVYLVWSLLWLVLWIGLFIALRNTRKEMIVVSVLFSVMGPLAMLFHIEDYFVPVMLFSSPWSIENWIIGFTTGGIGASLYELFCVACRRKRERPGTLALVLGATVVGTVCMFVLLALGVNSLYASLVVLFSVGASMVFARPHLLRNAIASGVLLAVFMIVFYNAFLLVYPDLFIDFWRLDNVSGVFVVGIPLEELLWGFITGFVLGPASELARDVV